MHLFQKTYKTLFQKKIAYKLNGKLLEANISDEQNTISFVFRKNENPN